MRSLSSDPFLNDIENIHLATWTKDETYESLLINEKSEGKYSQMLTYNAVVKKSTYGLNVVVTIVGIDDGLGFVMRAFKYIAGKISKISQHKSLSIIVSR